MSDAGRATGVSYSGSDFPLVNPSVDVQGLLADFYVAHRVREAKLPLRLSWVRGLVQPPGSGSSSSAGGRDADLVVVDGDDATVFDTRTAADYSSWALGRLTIHEWLGTDAVCRVVQHNEGPDGPGAYPYEFEPVAAILDERCSEAWPKTLEGLIVNDQTLTGQILIESGYNTVTTLTGTDSAPGKPLRQKVGIGLAAGGGLGTYPGCLDPRPVLRRINQRTADGSGNFRLSAAECYWLSRDGVLGEGGTLEFSGSMANGLRLNNDCRPCCDCDDYVNTYAAVRRLYEQYRELGSRSVVARDKHAENRARWLAQKECRANRSVRVAMLPYRARGMSVAVGYVNADSNCIGQVTLVITFTGPIGSVDQDTVVSYPPDSSRPQLIDLNGVWPVYSVTWESVRTGQSPKVRFQLSCPAAAANESLRMDVQAYLNGIPEDSDTITRGFVI